MLKATVTVRLKDEVSDPQGHAVLGSLETLHPGFAKRVRVGKILEIDLLEEDRGRAREELENVCHKVLSNPVIESYEYEITERDS